MIIDITMIYFSGFHFRVPPPQLKTKTMGTIKIYFGHYVRKYGPWYCIPQYLLCRVDPLQLDVVLVSVHAGPFFDDGLNETLVKPLKCVLCVHFRRRSVCMSVCGVQITYVIK